MLVNSLEDEGWYQLTAVLKSAFSIELKRIKLTQIIYHHLVRSLRL